MNSMIKVISQDGHIFVTNDDGIADDYINHHGYTPVFSSVSALVITKPFFGGSKPEDVILEDCYVKKT